MTTLLAVDYGHKKLGFAVGQTVTGTASPLSVIAQNGEMWRKIDTLFAQWRPDAVVIGEPKLADGKQHPLEKPIQTFAAALKKRYAVDIYRENEALTSYEAGKYQTGKEHLDAHAAAIFLESWMREHQNVSMKSKN